MTLRSCKMHGDSCCGYAGYLASSVEDHSNGPKCTTDLRPLRDDSGQLEKRVLLSGGWNLPPVTYSSLNLGSKPSGAIDFVPESWFHGRD